MPEITEDEKYFGRAVMVYCNQHLRPHSTGWCTVSIDNKIKLEADNIKDAYAECEALGLKVYQG